MKRLIMLLCFSLLGILLYAQSPCDAKMYDTLSQDALLDRMHLLKTFSLHVDSLSSIAHVNVIVNNDTPYSLVVGNASFSQTKVWVRVKQGAAIHSETLVDVGEVIPLEFTAKSTGMYSFIVEAVEPSEACVTLALGYFFNQ